MEIGEYSVRHIKGKICLYFVWASFFAFLCWQPALADGQRLVISLNGTWQIDEGGMQAIPQRFDHNVPVPGLVEMATPKFPEVGFKSAKRQAFWYKRKFNIDSAIPELALVKVHKAMFGSKVFVNGQVLGEHMPSFTPGYFNAKPALRQGENEIVIRVGAFMDAVPKPIPSGWDYEKYKFIPGIFDSVEVILGQTPFIDRVQVQPVLESKSINAYAWISAPGMKKVKLHYTVSEAKSGRQIAEGDFDADTDGDVKGPSAKVSIPIPDCRLWSPEDPFLYELSVASPADKHLTRFGMRSFRLDPKTGRAVLNGRPYFMRGSNITLYRFFEDADCGGLPWNEDWVRRLHKACKNFNWNTLRYCIGFPPEFWYRIADEEGILIQDEFPIWNMDAKKGDYDPKELAGEYKEWMQERWNHPCVVIWDACNETNSPEIEQAIKLVRNLDYSNRPFDNGWRWPKLNTDSRELHPYHFQDPNFKLSQITSDDGKLGWVPGLSPIIVNEYGWLWTNRDGTPTSLTRELYQNLLGAKATPAERFNLYARYTAAETEFWRARRALAAVMHFCILGYSRPGDGDRPVTGATSDHFTNVEKLEFEPLFKKYVGDSFAPVGLMIDAFADDYKGGAKQEFPVIIINDLYDDWAGPVRFRLLKDSKVIQEQTKECKVSKLGKETIRFTVEIPTEPGKYQVEAALMKPISKEVISLRDFNVYRQY